MDLMGTDFRKEVWSELTKIPYGKTLSYKEQAIKLNKLSAIRAVAAANGKNMISIIIPCHRVISTNGKLVGYAGGIEKKGWLINFEKENSTSNKPDLWSIVKQNT
jgi:methylated-DNA-[protein]-cysteine S-methyltransferase